MLGGGTITAHCWQDDGMRPQRTARIQRREMSFPAKGIEEGFLEEDASGLGLEG